MADRVLQSSPELLHEIFLCLPQRDLLLVQRVCRTWNHIISSSRRLQAELFFHSGTKPAHDTPQAPEFNPLLQERFPDFLNGRRHRGQLDISRRRNLGPWATTDWWRGNKERKAAYSRAEASWRRMIPFRPLPHELQVSYGCESRGGMSRRQLKRLNFSNQDQCDQSSNVEGTTSRHPWLTFGLLYDVVEHKWFHRSYSERIFWVQFDYPTENSVSRPISRPGLEPLEDSESQRTIGGPGCLLVHLNYVRQCVTITAPEEVMKHPKNEFKSEGSVTNDMKWDERILYQRVRRDRANVP